MLDEADEMLDMGFADDLERILGALPLERQTALFSATIAGPIARLAEAHLRQPVRVRVQSDRPAAGRAGARPPGRLRRRRADKLAALGRILDLEDGAATLVFARTRGEVDDLAEALSGRGRDAAALHGGLSQEQRDRIMGRFREGALDVLVATDVAARGLDIEHVSHVVNYDVPSSPDTYVHRIGRTGRAGREGVAITLVEPREHRHLRDIERSIGAPLEIQGLPTVADLREHRLELLKASLREALVAGAFERYRAVVESLSERVRRRGHRAGRGEPGRCRGPRRGGRDRARPGDAAVLRRSPAPAARAARRRHATAVRRGAPGRVRAATAAPRASTARRAATARPGRTARRRRPAPPARSRARQRPRPGRATQGLPRDRVARRGGPTGHAAPARRGAGGAGGEGGGVTRLFVGAGRAAGMRPGDLVGAITNEAGLRGNDIGAIQIADGFSLVEVPEDAAEHVIRSLRGATIRGQKVMVRRERY